MMVLLVAFAAVGADELDAIVFDAIDRAEMHAVGADHFHMLTDILEAAHDLLLAGNGDLTLRSRVGFSSVPTNYA
jgi:hypothetical protein